MRLQITTGHCCEQVREVAEHGAALRALAERPLPPAVAAQTVVLPGELQEDEQRIVAALRVTHPELAGQLAALLSAQGPQALDQLVVLLPSWATNPPIEFWSAVHQLCNAADRFTTARDAALREADDPRADRPGALIKAAVSAYAAGDESTADRLYGDARRLEADHPAVLLCAAQRVSGHAERLTLADRAVPRTDRERAWQQAERALALLGLGHDEEAASAAAASFELNPHGPGVEAKHLTSRDRRSQRVPASRRRTPQSCDGSRLAW